MKGNPPRCIARNVPVSRKGQGDSSRPHRIHNRRQAVPRAQLPAWFRHPLLPYWLPCLRRMISCGYVPALHSVRWWCSGHVHCLALFGVGCRSSISPKIKKKILFLVPGQGSAGLSWTDGYASRVPDRRTSSR